MTRTGTSYFKTIRAAEDYYRPYGYANLAQAVHEKIKDGEIHIGQPNLKPGQRLVLIDGGTRYAIEE